jgi:hypothetical protein
MAFSWFTHSVRNVRTRYRRPHKRGQKRTKRTLVPHRVGLDTGLSKFVRVRRRSRSIDQNNDYRRASGRISQYRTTKKPTPKMPPTTTGHPYLRDPLLAPFSALSISRAIASRPVRIGRRPPSPDSTRIPTVIYPDTMVSTAKVFGGNSTH